MISSLWFWYIATIIIVIIIAVIDVAILLREFRKCKIANAYYCARLCLCVRKYLTWVHSNSIGCLTFPKRAQNLLSVLSFAWWNCWTLKETHTHAGREWNGVAGGSHSQFHFEYDTFRRAHFSWYNLWRFGHVCVRKLCLPLTPRKWQYTQTTCKIDRRQE